MKPTRRSSIPCKHPLDLPCLQLVFEPSVLSSDWEERLLALCAAHDMPLTQVHWVVQRTTNEVVLSLTDTDRTRLERLAAVCRRSLSSRLKEKRWIHHRHPHDWLNVWRKGFRPFRLTPSITVVPSWNRRADITTEHRLVLDPDAAFGTGLHETTRLCARLLSDDTHFSGRFLDVGTGSGILMITAFLTNRMSRIIGLDRDAYALSVAERHLQWNQVTGALLVCCDVVQDNVFSEGSFDCFAANLQTDVLESLLDAGRLAAWMTCGARGVVSGVLDLHAGSFERRLQRAERWLIHQHAREGDWHAWIIERC